MAVSVSSVLPSSSLKCLPQISHVQYSLLPSSVQVAGFSAVWVRVPWVTVTSQVAVFPLPSAAVAVMVAVPALLAVTVPFASTVATAALSLLQVTFLLVALSGVMVAVRVSVFPSVKFKVSWFSVTPVTGTTAASMVIENSLVSPIIS